MHPLKLQFYRICIFSLSQIKLAKALVIFKFKSFLKSKFKCFFLDQVPLRMMTSWFSSIDENQEVVFRSHTFFQTWIANPTFQILLWFGIKNFNCGRARGNISKTKISWFWPIGQNQEIILCSFTKIRSLRSYLL